MNELEGKPASYSPTPESRIVALVVERGEDGMTRLVLEGAYMDVTGFMPGDRVEAIVQPELISILPPE